jgi:type VI secretion system secreted protein VgrG
MQAKARDALAQYPETPIRVGQDSEYPELARLRASGDEEGVRRIAANGIIDRAIRAGSQQFSDLGVKAALMSLAHMRGPAGAMSIMNGVGTGGLDKSGRASSLDPRAVETINNMARAEVMRRLEIARTAYDRAVLGEAYWRRFGRGLSDRYRRERQFYTAL